MNTHIEIRGTNYDDWNQDSLSINPAQSIPLTINPPSTTLVHNWNLTASPSVPKLLDWNITTQLDDEDDDSYRNRLEAIGGVLAQTINENPSLAVIGLQDIPDDDDYSDILLNALENNLDPEVAAKWDLRSYYKRKDESDYGVLTLVNTAMLDVTATPDFSPEEEEGENGDVLPARYTAQVTDLKLKKRTPADPDPNIAFRFVNYRFNYGSKDERREDVDSFYEDYPGQVVVAGQFHGMEDLNNANEDDETKFSQNNANGFLFQHDPATFRFTSAPVLPLVETESPFPSKIKYNDLAQNFTSKGFTVTRDIPQDLVTLTKGSDKVEIKKTSTDRLSFKANNSSDESLRTMAEAAELCLQRGTKIKIEVTCADPNRAADVEAVKNKAWLEYVKKGFEVEGPLPSEAFREANRTVLEALPRGEERFFPRPAAGPGRGP